MTKLRRRTLTRLLAVQSLYQADLLQISLPPTSPHIQQLLRDAQRLQEDHLSSLVKAVDPSFYTLLVQGALSALPTVDALLMGHLCEGWTFDRLDNVVKAILRLGTYEVLTLESLSPGVILSEYTDIADSFFDTPETKKFVNGVLSGVVKTVREGYGEKDSEKPQDNPLGNITEIVVAST